MCHYIILLFFIVLVNACGVIRPSPIVLEKHYDYIKQEHQKLISSSPKVDGKLTFCQAVSLAIINNLDIKIKLLEEALNVDTAELSSVDLLPKVLLSAGYKLKDPLQASRSVKAEDNDNIPFSSSSLSTYSISEIRHQRNLDISYSWSLLDFAVGYLRAHQKCDGFLIAQERFRRARQDLVKQVYNYYWHGAMLELFESRAQSLIYRINQTLCNMITLKKLKIKDPFASTSNTQELLETRSKITELLHKFYTARLNLFSLLNLPLDTQIHFDIPSLDLWAIPEVSNDLEELITQALLLRPESRQEYYQNRIDCNILRQSIAELFPGFSLDFSRHYDNNPYLRNRLWNMAGVSLSASVFKLLSFPTYYKQLKTQQQITEAHLLSTYGLIMMQTAIALDNYQLSLSDYTSAINISRNNSYAAKNARAFKLSGLKNGVETTVWEGKQLVSEMQLADAYANLQNSYGTLNNTLGIE